MFLYMSNSTIRWSSILEGMERLSDLLRDTEGLVFRDDEFATHLEQVAASEDDLPAYGFFAIGAGGPPDASRRVEDFVGAAIDRRHPTSVSTSEVEWDAVREHEHGTGDAVDQWGNLSAMTRASTARTMRQLDEKEAAAGFSWEQHRPSLRR